MIGMIPFVINIRNTRLNHFLKINIMLYVMIKKDLLVNQVNQLIEYVVKKILLQIPLIKYIKIKLMHLLRLINQVINLQEIISR